LKIDTLTISDTGVDTVSDTELDLQAGRIFASVKKLSDSRKYLVKIPNGIAGVRGTKFTLGADGSAGVHPTRCLACLWRFRRPTTIQVPEGTQYDPATGKVGRFHRHSQPADESRAAGTSYFELFPMLPTTAS